MSRDSISVDEYKRLLAGEMTEAEFQHNLEQRLDERGWLWFHRNDKGDQILAAQKRYYALSKGKGFYDIVAQRGDRCLFIEIKEQGGGRRPEQRAWAACAQALEASTGGLVSYHYWRPTHLLSGEVDEALA